MLRLVSELVAEVARPIENAICVTFGRYGSGDKNLNSLDFTIANRAPNMPCVAYMRGKALGKGAES